MIRCARELLEQKAKQLRETADEILNPDILELEIDVK
jgi:hypothetical protein